MSPTAEALASVAKSVERVVDVFRRSVTKMLIAEARAGLKVEAIPAMIIEEAGGAVVRHGTLPPRVNVSEALCYAILLAEAATNAMEHNAQRFLESFAPPPKKKRPRRKK